MTKFKRAFCGILAAFLIVYVPVASYASFTASAAITVGEYVINLILDACGVDFSASSVLSILGQWTDYEDYMAKGAKGELGAFSQYLYNQSLNAKTEELKADARKQIEALNNAVNSAWGAVVTGVKGLISAVKSWLLSPEISGYCTDSTTYFAYKGGNVNFEFGVDTFISSERYPIRMPYSYTYAYGVMNNPENEFSFSGISPSYYSGYAYVTNFYKPKTVEVFGLLVRLADVSKVRINFYMKDGETYKSYNFFYHYESAVDANDNYKFNRQDSCYGTAEYVTCKEIHVGNFPFPIFTNVEAMEQYCKTGTLTDIYEPGKIALTADAINTDIQNLPFKSIPDTITLPGSREEALKQSETVSSALIEGEESLKIALEGAGITIDWEGKETPEKPDPKPDDDNDKKKPIWLGWVIGEILDWLLGETLEDLIDWLLDGTRKINEDEGEIIVEPVAKVKDRFPFCIPFDLIYLVQALEAESEIPRFEIPINISYEFIEYHETFVVDFYDWITVVNVLRAMLDIWLLAGLIVTTRDLMRG